MMPETLQEFHARVDGFQRDSLPHAGGLTTKPLLVEKVAPDGTLLPFFGNTMIFDLPMDAKIAVARMQLLLHHRCAGMLAEPLTPAALHMTLHDLLNGVDEAALAEPVRQTGTQAKAILADIRAARLPALHLTSTLAFNMTGGSVTLGFAPDTEDDCALLMALHARYQAVVALDYPLTPHVTLAYFRPGWHSPEMVAALADTLARINALPKVHITLTANELHYCRFADMNTYLRE